MFHAILVNRDHFLNEGKAEAIASGPVATFNEVKKTYDALIPIPTAIRDVSVIVYQEGISVPVASLLLDKSMPWCKGNHSGRSAAGFIATADVEIDAFVQGNGVVRTEQNEPWHFLNISIKPIIKGNMTAHLPAWVKQA